METISEPRDEVGEARRPPPPDEVRREENSMNEIISSLQRVEEKARAKLVAIKATPIYLDKLSYRAVYEMAYDHLHDTIYLFRHARKLKQELDADSRQTKGDGHALD